MLPSVSFEAPRFWAIPLESSSRLHWTNETSEKSLLTYNWEQFHIPGNANQTDISISVAKTLPGETPKKIKKIAFDIYHFARLKKDDGILAISGDRSVKKVGRIISNTPLVDLRYSVDIAIEWETNIKEGYATSPIFSKESDIISVNQRMLDRLRLPVKLSDKESFYEKSERIYFKDPLQYLKFENIKKLQSDAEKEDTGGEITLFYGTNRNRTGSENVNEFYGNEFESNLKCGFCKVTIPRGHIQGELERPLTAKLFKVFEIQLLPENARKHIVLNEISELSTTDFQSTLAENVATNEEKSALIFIHGYNNSFADAARRIAQIAWDVPFTGATGFFSWPSRSRALAYTKDIEHADASIPFLEQFIEMVIEKGKVEKLHIIAHSMGNRLMTAVMNRLLNKASFKSQQHLIHQIVLAAPDIDQNVFQNTILPEFQNAGIRRTIYASDQDEALSSSETLRLGLPRLGDGGNSLFVANGVDTVDASNIESGGNHHSYIFETKELLTDLHYLLNFGMPPVQRRLRARVKNKLTYWLFPK